MLDRVADGERIIVTRDGRPVAELQPLAVRAVQSEILLARWRNLPRPDGNKFRADITRVLDSSV